jgi:hypothetical protein
METIDLSKMSTSDLKQALALKEKEENEQKKQLKAEYEKKRDHMVKSLTRDASATHKMLKEFKKMCLDLINGFQEDAKEYGDIRSNSKGGFSLRSADGSSLVALRRNVIHEYDERADLALMQIREFLEETIKKKDMQTYRTVSTLLEKNKAGDLNPSRVADLLKIKDNYDDSRWLKAMELLTESYREREISYNVEFFEKDEMGKDQPITLTFASL